MLQWSSIWLSTPTWVGKSLSSWYLVCITVAKGLLQTQWNILVRTWQRGAGQRSFSAELQAFWHFSAHSAPLALSKSIRQLANLQYSADFSNRRKHIPCYSIIDWKHNNHRIPQTRTGRKRISYCIGLLQLIPWTYFNSLLLSLLLYKCPFQPALQTQELYISFISLLHPYLGLEASLPTFLSPSLWKFCLPCCASVPIFFGSSQVYESHLGEENLYLQVQIKAITVFKMWIANLRSDELSVPFVPQIITQWL